MWSYSNIINTSIRDVLTAVSVAGTTAFDSIVTLHVS
jgi:hypothetical protein